MCMNSHRKKRCRPIVLLEAGRDIYLVRYLFRLIASAQVDIHLFAPKDQPFRHSHFVSEWIEGPHEPESRAFALDHFLKSSECRFAMVVLVTEIVFEVFATNNLGGRHFNWLTPEIRNSFCSKTAFATWAARNGILFPDSHVCPSIEDGIQWMEQTQYTCMIKVDHMGSGQGVRHVKDAGDLTRVWTELGAPAVFLLQRFIAGRTGATELVAHKGTLLAWFSSTKARTRTPFSPSIAREFYVPDGMSELSHKVIEKSGFHGFCGFDWIEDEKTGQAYVIEFHPRTSSGYYWGNYWHVDITQALKNLFHDQPVPVKCPELSDRHNKYPLCCYFPEHLFHALKGNFSDLKYWLPGSNSVSWRNTLFWEPRVCCSVLWRVLKSRCGKRLLKSHL